MTPAPETDLGFPGDNIWGDTYGSEWTPASPDAPTFQQLVQLVIDVKHHNPHPDLVDESYAHMPDAAMGIMSDTLEHGWAVTADEVMQAEHAVLRGTSTSTRLGRATLGSPF